MYLYLYIYNFNNQFYLMYFSKASIFHQFRSQGNPSLSFTVGNKINLVLAS